MPRPFPSAYVHVLLQMHDSIMAHGPNNMSQERHQGHWELLHRSAVHVKSIENGASMRIEWRDIRHWFVLLLPMLVCIMCSQQSPNRGSETHAPVRIMIQQSSDLNTARYARSNGVHPSRKPWYHIRRHPTWKTMNPCMPWRRR